MRIASIVSECVWDSIRWWIHEMNTQTEWRQPIIHLLLFCFNFENWYRASPCTVCARKCLPLRGRSVSHVRPWDGSQYTDRQTICWCVLSCNKIPVNKLHIDIDIGDHWTFGVCVWCVWSGDLYLEKMFLHCIIVYICIACAYARAHSWPRSHIPAHTHALSHNTRI